MTAKIRPYYWMIDHTPQHEWIEGMGICLLLTFVLGGIGGGLYLVSMYFNNPYGLLIGWVIAVIVKGGIHIFELGRPLRAWRLMFRPKSSWITRGFFFEAGFGLFGALHIAPLFFPGLPWGANNIVFGTLAPIFAFLLVLYAGFVMNYNNSIALWNNALLPILFIIYGLLDGCGIFLIISTLGGFDPTHISHATALNLIFLVSAIVTVAVYLTSVNYTNTAGKESVRKMIKGSLSRFFYIGLLLLGMAIPFVVFMIFYKNGSISVLFLLFAVACQILGSFTLRYCILKGGVYMPLVDSNIALH